LSRPAMFVPLMRCVWASTTASIFLSQPYKPGFPKWLPSWTSTRVARMSVLPSIALQNSKKGFQRFFREKSNQAIIADRCVLWRAAEVAGEFITSCCGPPHDCSIAALTALKICLQWSEKSFATLSPQEQTSSAYTLRSVSCHLPTHAPQQTSYSITSSARASRAAAISMPSSLAALRLRTNWNLVACSTGMSPGFAPLRILSARAAARRNISENLTP
jgi:hypothetical protein